MQNIYLIRSKETGRWWDSDKRIILDVEEGDVVGFGSIEDAEHFVRHDRAEPLTEDEIETLMDEPEGDPEEEDLKEAAPPKPKPAAKTKSKRTSGKKVQADDEKEAGK